LQPGPINTFPKWKDLGRYVKRGERALTLCMPITCKRRNDETDDDESNEGTFTSFVYKARWFVLAQTEGEEITLPIMPKWEATIVEAISKIGCIRESATTPKQFLKRAPRRFCEPPIRSFALGVPPH